MKLDMSKTDDLRVQFHDVQVKEAEDMVIRLACMLAFGKCVIEGDVACTTARHYLLESGESWVVPLINMGAWKDFMKEDTFLKQYKEGPKASLQALSSNIITEMGGFLGLQEYIQRSNDETDKLAGIFNKIFGLAGKHSTQNGASDPTKATPDKPHYKIRAVEVKVDAEGNIEESSFPEDMPKAIREAITGFAKKLAAGEGETPSPSIN